MDERAVTGEATAELCAGEIMSRDGCCECAFRRDDGVPGRLVCEDDVRRVADVVRI